MELSLQVQQKQILSQKMQQSVEILQMNAVTLSEYIREFAEENPLVEWNEEKEPVQQENTELLQKLEWLEETDEQNRSLYRMEHEQEEKERETNAFGRKEGQSLREFLLFQINIQKIPAGHKPVLRFLAESTAESGYLEKDAIEMMMEKYPMKKSTAARILAQFQALEPSGVGARNLQECLLIQLKQKNASALSMKITRNYLDELSEADYTGKRILLVEDNELNREIAVEILQMTGAEVETAENGKIAVEKVEASPEGLYDLVFMDIQMPVMNGYEATAAIRSLPGEKGKLPIVAMTANAFAEDVQLAKNTGMNGHIAKPLDMNKLNDVLENWL